MRLLLVLLLVHGLAPGLGEVAESAVHFAVDARLAHADSDCGDPGDQGCERGCGPTGHRCVCCTSLSFVAPASGIVFTAAPAPSRPLPAGERLASLDAPAPPLRPPIAS